MRVNPQTGTLDVASVARYEHFARVMGHYPEPNNFVNLWDKVGVDVLHICRDDPMHMVQLGLMPHLLQACISRCISALSPRWACDAGQAVGRHTMIKICERMGRRLGQSAPHLKHFAAQAFARSFRTASLPGDGRGAGKMNWGLTAFEMEALFRASVLCWKGLIDEELKVLNSESPAWAGSATAEDPTEDMAATLASFLSWYNAMRQRKIRQSSVSMCMPTRARPHDVLARVNYIMFVYLCNMWPHTC